MDLEVDMIGLARDVFVIVDQIAKQVVAHNIPMTQEKSMGVDGGTRNWVCYGHIFSSM
jgi:lipoprotein signal peptidase